MRRQRAVQIPRGHETALALAGTHFFYGPGAGGHALLLWLVTRASIGAAALAIVAGGTGNISSRDVTADAGPSPGLTPGVAGSTVTPLGDTPLDCSQPSVAYAPLRRLTREQYDNAVRDRLGSKSFVVTIGWGRRRWFGERDPHRRYLELLTPPADFGFWLRFRCGPMLTYSSTLRFGPRESLAKSPNLVGGCP